MEAVIISPKYQIVIPKKIRELLNLLPGQKIQIIPFDDRLEMVPERNIIGMRGFLKGINTEVVREGDRV